MRNDKEGKPMTEPFTREALQQMRERAEAGWSVGTPTLLRLIAMAERFERWRPVLGLLVGLREDGSIRTDGRSLYDAIDTVTGLRADAATPEQMAKWAEWFNELMKDTKEGDRR